MAVTEEEAKTLAAEALSMMLEGKDTRDILRMLDVSDELVREASVLLGGEAVTLAKFTQEVIEALNHKADFPMNAVQATGYIGVQCGNGDEFEIRILRR